MAEDDVAMVQPPATSCSSANWRVVSSIENRGRPDDRSSTRTDFRLIIVGAVRGAVTASYRLQRCQGFSTNPSARVRSGPRRKGPLGELRDRGQWSQRHDWS